MNCPIPHEVLVRYWAGDVSDDEIDTIEEHVFGCAACFEASSRVAALGRAIAEVIPPVAIGRDIVLAEARGVRHATNDIRPGVATETWLRAGTDLLVHRLLGDLEDVVRISVDIVLPDGSRLLSFGDVPFEPSAGAVLIACQRHFVERFPPDVDIVVRRTHRAGRESVDSYTVLHRIG
jgi:hypothetical protein